MCTSIYIYIYIILCVIGLMRPRLLLVVDRYNSNITVLWFHPQSLYQRPATRQKPSALRRALTNAESGKSRSGNTAVVELSENTEVMPLIMSDETLDAGAEGGMPSTPH